MRDINIIDSELNNIIDRQQSNTILIKTIERESNELSGLLVKLKDVEKQLIKEEKDVEKLKTVSFSNFFQTVMNSKDEKLRQEEKEVVEVKTRLDHLIFSIDETRNHIKVLESDKKNVNELARQYNNLCSEKLQCLEVIQPDKYKQIIDNSKEIEVQKRNIKEVEEAIVAGNHTLSEVDTILNSLQSAANWGTYDMLGGGLIATMAKRGHMNDAQTQMQSFKRSLSMFNKELGDVSDTVVMELSLNGFLDMADYFFDGFFVDWAVQDKINNARTQVNNIQAKIKSIVYQLQNELGGFNREIKMLELKNSDLIVSA